MYARWPEFPLVSISERPAPAAARCQLAGDRPARARRRCVTASPPSPSGGYLAFLGRISPEKRPDRAIEIAAARACPEDRGQGRPGRSRLLPRGDRALARRPAGRVHRRDRRRREVRVSGQRQGAAVPDRLAGAVRPRDDRGHGLRDPGDRVALRARCRRWSSTASAASSSTTWTRRWPRSAGSDKLDRRLVRRCFERRFTAEVMASNYLRLYWRLYRDSPGEPRASRGRPRTRRLMADTEPDDRRTTHSPSTAVRAQAGRHLRRGRRLRRHHRRGRWPVPRRHAAAVALPAEHRRAARWSCWAARSARTMSSSPPI